MNEISIVIPNYNGLKYLKDCLDSLRKQTFDNFTTIVVDNGSSDGSSKFIEENYKEVVLIKINENTGFCYAVNRGIEALHTPYVILLNNDTVADPDFVGELYKAIQVSTSIFSCQAKMLQLNAPDLIDDAGNFYSILGWAFAEGKGKTQELYNENKEIFASCAGAAIYRRAILDDIGLFDEKHFAYLEDIDIGYRAKINGYKNVFVSKAVVYHVGSGTTGSQYNQFKVRYSSRNNIYLIYKNMPLLQLLINLPFLILGFCIKILFFIKKGMHKEYFAGIKNGFHLSFQGEKVKFRWRNLRNYFKIELELFINLLKRLQ